MNADLQEKIDECRIELSEVRSNASELDSELSSLQYKCEEITSSADTAEEALSALEEFLEEIPEPCAFRCETVTDPGASGGERCCRVRGHGGDHVPFSGIIGVTK